MALRHTEAGDILHHALMVLDTYDGSVVTTLVDTGSNLDPTAWSPRMGDERLLFTSELGPFERPAIWEPRTGARRDLPVDLPGAAIPVGWWPDASAILIRHEFEGAFQLHLDGSEQRRDHARRRPAGGDHGRGGPAGR